MPKRLLVDNAKAFVDDARPDYFTWNQRFLELCGHHQIEPQACRVRRAQTKGKIERPFSFLEEQFIKGSHFADLAALNAALARFQEEELDQVVHATTQERPLDRFAIDVPTLTPLPTGRFQSGLEEARKVSLDCLVSYGGSRYSVPHPYAGTRVWVRAVLGTRVEIFDLHGGCLASHARAAKRGLTVICPEHYAGLRRPTPLTKVILSAALLARFPDQQWFVAGVLAAYPTNPAVPLRAILDLSALYPDDALRAAFAAAVAYQCFTPQFVRGVVEQHGVRSEAPQRLPVILAPLPALQVTRPLSVYQQLLRGGEG